MPFPSSAVVVHIVVCGLCDHRVCDHRVADLRFVTMFIICSKCGWSPRHTVATRETYDADVIIEILMSEMLTPF